MVGWATAYWMGLNAAENARLDRQMWDIAARATRRRQVPVDDRAALIDQVARLQAQLQQVLAEQDKLRAQCNTTYHAWATERNLRQRAESMLDFARCDLDENHPLNWDRPP